MSLGLRSEERAEFSAVHNTGNQNLGNPFINNYNLALHKKGKCIRVSNGLRTQRNLGKLNDFTL